ncbi:hypothetical protein Ancab_022678 [Ancistrocladus abbreviatus]
MEQDNAGQAITSTSGSRRTRSQVAPEWSVQDALILINEISAVEGDCAKALSSYQKWTIIAENCTALEVVRNAYQCRRKWDSLLSEYKMIKGWELRSEDNVYWSIDHEMRKKLGLPIDFDEVLYSAIDTLVKAQEERSDTESDSDPEAQIDVLHEKEFGSQKLRRRSNPQKGTAEEDHLFIEKEHKKAVPTLEAEIEMLDEKPSGSKNLRHRRRHQKGTNEDKVRVFIEKERKNAVPVLEAEIDTLHGKASGSRKPQHRSDCQKGTTEEEHIFTEKECKDAVSVLVAESDMPHERASGSKRQKRRTAEEKRRIFIEKEHKSAVPVLGENGQLLAAKVQENADIIHAILSGKANEDEESGFADLKNEEALETERTRRKADKLVVCLGDLAKHLEQLCTVVEERHGSNR